MILLFIHDLSLCIVLSPKKLPFSFNDLWITNRERNPNRELRNANDCFIPSHKMASLKQLPLFSLPKVWNEELERKNIALLDYT